ncbi:MAG: hypothetical protein K0S32_328 [Bacteroidetes bacterium]|jgi:hypothetical protein|nr:hypothetical protein [Bacteroidota bacterium]
MVVLISCSEAKREEHSGKNSGKDSLVVNDVLKKSVTNLNYNFTPDKQKTPWQGTLTASVSWEDANGSNIIIFSEIAEYRYDWQTLKPSMLKHAEKYLKEEDQVAKLSDLGLAEVFAYHYIFNRTEKKWRLYWTLNDFDFSATDIVMTYNKNSLLISDIDSNGVGESLFTYRRSAGTGTMDHFDMVKMILHADSVKYKIAGPSGYGWEMMKRYEKIPKTIFDPKLKSLPLNFQTFFTRKWKVYDSLKCISDEKEIMDNMKD